MKNIAFLILGVLTTSAYLEDNVTPDEHIRKIIEDIQTNVNVNIKGQQIYCKTLLSEFYINRQFEPAWKNKGINAFIDELSDIDASGLIPEDYHLNAITILAAHSSSSAEKAELDILLTDAFLLCSSHLLNGKVNPETLESEWMPVRRENNSIEILEKAISGKSIIRFLALQEPQDQSYKFLKEKLDDFKTIADNVDWPIISNEATLKPGMQDSIRVPMLIERLIILGDLDDEYDHANNVYTPALVEAVKRYQSRHGLEVDGNLGKMTTASLNVTVQERIDQIIVNMERHRWISHNLGDRYVFVNIAGFQMKVIEKGEVVFSEKVIVGKPFRMTPVFSTQMTYVVLNPYWTIPPVILYNDILPEMTKNPGYLASKNIRVLKGYGSDALEIDPSTLNWSGFAKGNFPYILRQDPGKLNALGQVKFMFPNKYNVYIHDTPSKELFNRAERIFSSGCIRLNNPLSFLEYLIQYQPDLSMEKVNQLLSVGKEHTFILKKPLNVHIQYLTCWADDEIIHFRNDVYNRDKAILTALKGQPTTEQLHEK